MYEWAGQATVICCFTGRQVGFGMDIPADRKKKCMKNFTSFIMMRILNSYQYNEVVWRYFNCQTSQP